METMEIVSAAFRDLSYLVVNHPVYSVFGCFVLSVGLVKFYCRLTLGICDSDQDMTGKTVLITGATAGIGKATAEDLARRNARVILACRNMDKARWVAEDIVSSTGNKQVIVKHLDLSSFNSVRKCAESVLNTEDRLHILINNAGIYSSDKKITEDGCEFVLQSNHLGHFLLTLLLLDLLRKSAPSRIINVSSSAHQLGKMELSDMEGKNCKGDLELYTRSKLANILFTRELSSRLSNSGVTVNALHPGVVKTDIISTNCSFFYLLNKSHTAICGEGVTVNALHPGVVKTDIISTNCSFFYLLNKSHTAICGEGVTVNALHPGVVKTDIISTNCSFFIYLTKAILPFVGKNCEEGAQTTIYLAVHPEVEKISGKYFSDCKEEKLKRLAVDKTLAKELFEISEKIVGVSYQNK